MDAPPQEDTRELLERSRRAMRMRRFSLRTEETYLDWQRRFLAFCEEENLRPNEPGLCAGAVRPIGP